MAKKLLNGAGLNSDGTIDLGGSSTFDWLSELAPAALPLPDLAFIADAVPSAGTTAVVALPTTSTPTTTVFTSTTADVAGPAGSGGASSQNTLLLVAGLSDQTGPAPGSTLTSDATIGGRAIDTAAITSLSVAVDGGTQGNLTADLQSDGRFTLTPAMLALLNGGTLAAGTHSVTIAATDASANTASVTVNFDLETTAPTFSAALANDTGISATDGITRDDTISGNATDAIGIIDLFGTLDGSSSFGDFTGSIAAGGSLSITPASLDALAGGTLADGHHTLTLQAVDGAGNTTTETINFTLETSVGVPVLNLTPTDQSGGPTIASSSQVVLIGTTTPGAAVTLSNNGALATAGANGVFQFPGTPINASGGTTLTVSVTDLAGNTNSGTLAVTHATGTGTPDAVIEWDTIMRQAIATDADPPTVASRTMAIESLSVYNAIAAINGTAGFLDNLAPAPNADPAAAVASAANAVLDGLYPGQTATFDAQLATDLAAIPDGPAKTAGIALGKASAAAMLASRLNDGSANNSITDLGSSGVGVWRPTGPSFAPALQPQWATVTPFALQSPSQFLPPAPPAINTQSYADAVNQTEQLGEANSTTRTADETTAAKFWNNQVGTDTPPGQWDSIAEVVAQQAGDSLTQDARLFAELNVALADGAIAAWNGKFTYNAWRPITLFQDPSASGNAAILGSPNWQPLITTPNFPEYPEGHGTFSGAAAAVLGAFFGDNTSFTASSMSTPGVTRNFTSFSQAAQEAAMSRIWGGIHFTFSASAALTLGGEIGQWTLGAFNTGADTTPPKVTLNVPADTTTNIDPAITGQVSSSFGVAALMASIDGGSAFNVPLNPDGSFAQTLSLPIDGSADGAHSATFIAIDPAGNASPAVNYNFNLFTKAPTITLAAGSVQNNGTLGANSMLDGTVGLEKGDTLQLLSYTIDGGAAVPIVANTATGAFDAPIDVTNLAPGPHVLRLSATDVAGNVTTAPLSVSYTLPPLTLSSISPLSNASNVGVTFRPSIEFSRPITPATVTAGDFFATDSTGTVIPSTVVPFTDGTGAWLLFNNPAAGASVITLHVVGSGIVGAADGAELDAAGSGTAGSTLTETYTTVSSASVTGTTISGIVVDPGADGTPFTVDDVKAAADGVTDYANDTWKLPIAGAKVFVLGQEQNAVFTDATGHFTLTNAPVGDVKVVVDGTFATNPPAGFFFPQMVLDITVRAGVNNTIPGGMGTPQQQAAMATDPAVYLPRVANNTLTPISNTSPTTVGTPPNADVGAGGFTMTPLQISEMSLTVQPNSIVDASGNPVSSPQVGIAPVPPSIVMDMLPAGLEQHSFDITIQAPQGAVFNAPATLTLPNVFGLAPGEKTYVLAFDHTTGRLVIQGTATASADGLTVTTDANSGVMAPGWHGYTPPGSQTNGNVGTGKNPLFKLFIDAFDGATNLLGTVSSGVGGIATILEAADTPALPVLNILGTVSDVGSIINDVGTGQSGWKIAGDVGKIALDVAGFVPGPIGIGASLIRAGIGIWEISTQNVPNITNDINAVNNQPPPNPFGQSAGLSSVTFGQIMSIGAAGLIPQSLIAAIVNDQLTLQAEEAFQVPILTKIAADFDIIDPLRKLVDPTKPNSGLTKAQFLSLTTAATDAANQAKLLDGHPSVWALVNQYGTDALNALHALSNALYAIYRAESFSHPVALAADPQVGPTLYGAFQAPDGSVLRISFASSDPISAFLAPNTLYELTVYDPTTGNIGKQVFTTSPSGQNTQIPLVGLSPDPGTPGTDGLTPTQAFVIGVNNAVADNLVPGITDLAALQQGLFNGSVLPSTTGIVASLPLNGSAQAIALAGSLLNPQTTYAFIATAGYGLAIADVSNAFSPVVLSQLQLSGTATSVAVDLATGVAVVATSAGLQFVDVTNTSAPALLQSLQVGATVVAAEGGILYANAGGNLDSFDMATGTLLQTLNLGGGQITGLVVQGNTLYTMDSTDTLRTIDLSTGAMAPEGSVGLPGGGNGLAVLNGVAYVAAGNGTATGDYITVNVSNPASPTLIEKVDNPGIAGAAIALNGSGTGITVQAIQEPPPNPGVHNVADLLNTSDSTKTGQLQTRFNLPAAPGGVAIADGIGFIADGTAGLQVLNYLAPNTTGVGPTVTVTTPPTDVDPNTTGTQLFEGVPISIGVSVTDPVQVRNVELLVNGTVAANSVSSPFDLTALMPTITANGGANATLQVQAIDTGGNIGLSTPIPVQLVTDTRPLKLLSENVSEGGVVSQFVRSFTATFSKPLNPATATTANFEIVDQNGTVVPAASITLAANNQAVKLNYGTLAVGSYKLEINGPQVTDAHGIALGSSIVVTDFKVEQFTEIFTNTAGGSWNTASNWSGNVVPSANDSVFVGNAIGATVSYDNNTDTVSKLVTSGGGSFQVTAGALGVNNVLEIGNQLSVDGGGALSSTGTTQIDGTGQLDVNNRNASVNNLSVAGGGGVQISNNNWLFASGSGINAGLITLDSIGNDTRMMVSGTLTLNGGGTVLMTDNANNSIQAAAAGAVLNDDGNTILGAGQIGDGTLAFNIGATGTVDASAANNRLVIAGGVPVANAGLMEDTGAAGLLITGTPVNNTGTIAASVAGSHVDLASATITGGLLTTANGGVIQAVDRTSALDNVTIATGAQIAITNNNWLQLQDTLTNQGTLAVNSIGNDTRVIVSGGVTLTGGGAVQLDDNANNSIQSAGASPVLTNVNNTISGSGQIGDGVLAVVNKAGGTIDATGANNNLVLFGGTSVNNAGLLEDTGPAGLRLAGASVTNTGTIAAPVSGSHVDLASAGITGGLLVTANGGVIQAVDRTSALSNVTLATGGVLAMTNNNWMQIQNTLTNKGTVELNSAGNDTRLVIAGSVTLTGGGAVQLSDNPNNSIQSNGAAAVLDNINNTIAGGGQLGDNGDALLAVTNATAGVIDANANNALVIALHAGTLANFGLIESTGTAAGNAGLQISNSVIDNTGSSNAGEILSTGTNSHVNLASATILGGTLVTNQGGVIQDIDRGTTIDNVTVAAAAQVAVVNDHWLFVQDGLSNKGTIGVDSGGNDTRLMIDNGVTLSGGGAVQLTDNVSNGILSAVSGVSLTNVDNTITGGGQIGDSGLAVTNEANGIINATSGNRLELTGVGFSNAGLLEDSGSGGLLIQSTGISNTGTVAANVAGSHVDLVSASITGGLLATANGGVIQAVNRTSVLDNVTLANAAQVVATNNNWLQLQDTLTNNGTLGVNSGGNDTRLIIAGTVTLKGGGAVQLTDNGNNLIVSNGAAAVLDNVDNTISGGGRIGDVGDPLLAVTNATAGVIDANAANELVIAMGGGTLANFGLLEATSGLQISSSVIDNTGSSNAGVILSTGNGSHVDLFSSTILGGTLTTKNGGVIQALDRGSTLENITVASGALVLAANNNWLTVQGTVTNKGTVAVGSGGNDTRLLISGGVTLTGGGVVQMSDNPGNTIGNAAAGAVLTNVDNAISGGGQIGDGNLSVVNKAGGTIDANDGNHLELTGVGFTNAGLLEATGGGGLLIASTTVTNSGTVSAAGSAVNLVSATIIGGVLTSSGGGAIQAVDRGSLVNGVTIAAGGVLAATNNNWLSLSNAVTNKGSIEVNSGGNDTRLIIATSATLSGGGVVQLTDNGSNSITSSAAGTTLINQDNTIEGAGSVGDVNMTIANGGTIESTGGNTLFLSTGANSIANSGLLQSAGGGGLVVNGSGGVANTGTLWADGDSLSVAGAVTGTGAGRITGAATLQLSGSVAAGQTITFDSGSTGTLRLDDSQQFGGSVQGLAVNGSNSLDLSDISFISGTTKATFNGGTLTVSDGSHSAAIKLIGDYAGHTFTTSTDNHNGTTVVDPAAPAPLASFLGDGGAVVDMADLLPYPAGSGGSSVGPAMFHGAGAFADGSLPWVFGAHVATGHPG